MVVCSFITDNCGMVTGVVCLLSLTLCFARVVLNPFPYLLTLATTVHLLVLVPAAWAFSCWGYSGALGAASLIVGTACSATVVLSRIWASSLKTALFGVLDRIAFGFSIFSCTVLHLLAAISVADLAFSWVKEAWLFLKTKNNLSGKLELNEHHLTELMYASTYRGMAMNPRQQELHSELVTERTTLTQQLGQVSGVRLALASLIRICAVFIVLSQVLNFAALGFETFEASYREKVSLLVFYIFALASLSRYLESSKSLALSFVLGFGVFSLERLIEKSSFEWQGVSAEHWMLLSFPLCCAVTTTIEVAALALQKKAKEY